MRRSATTQRAAAELWKFCFARGGGAHAEFVAGLLDRMTADAQTIDWRPGAYLLFVHSET